MSFYCRECGHQMDIDPDSGVSVHLDDDGETDHEMDADHVAVAESEEQVEDAKAPGKP